METYCSGYCDRQFLSLIKDGYSQRFSSSYRANWVPLPSKWFDIVPSFDEGDLDVVCTSLSLLRADTTTWLWLSISVIRLDCIPRSC